MRTVRRPRHYVARHWLLLLAPLFGYNHSRDAYVLRIGGRHLGPVLRPDRRVRAERSAEGARGERPSEGARGERPSEGTRGERSSDGGDRRRRTSMA